MAFFELRVKNREELVEGFKYGYVATQDCNGDALKFNNWPERFFIIVGFDIGKYVTVVRNDEEYEESRKRISARRNVLVSRDGISLFTRTLYRSSLYSIASWDAALWRQIEHAQNSIKTFSINVEWTIVPVLSPWSYEELEFSDMTKL